MEIIQFAVIALVVLVSSCLQGSIGFGLGMITAPVLILLHPELLPSTLLLLATLISGSAFLRERRDTDWKLVGWGVVGRIPGIVVGTLAVMFLPHVGLSFLLAATVIGGVAFSLVGWKVEAKASTMAIASGVSGIFGTATSIGGPPIALALRSLEPASMRATMSAYFTAGSILSLTGLAIGGQIQVSNLLGAAALLPFMLIGLLLSNIVIKRADRKALYYTAVGASVIGAILVIGEAVFSLVSG